ncbi:MAG: HTH domain-containing protein [Gemmataceae bacterium]
MVYQQSQAIERRLAAVVALIRDGRHTAPTLAAALGVSVPTVSRCLTALRDRGYDIRSVRDRGGCRYVVATSPGRAAGWARGGDPSHAAV